MNCINIRNKKKEQAYIKVNLNRNGTKMEFVLNLVLRGILGTIGIYLVNQTLLWQNIDCLIGINPYTVLTSATLGFPGLILLYGIRFYNFL